LTCYFSYSDYNLGQTEDQRTVLGIKQLNRISIWVSLGLGLVLGSVLGLMPSSDLVLLSTVLSSSCVPQFVHPYCQTDFKTSVSPVHRTTVVELNLELTITYTINQIGTMLTDDICGNFVLQKCNYHHTNHKCE